MDNAAKFAIKTTTRLIENAPFSDGWKAKKLLKFAAALAEAAGCSAEDVRKLKEAAENLHE